MIIFENSIKKTFILIFLFIFAMQFLFSEKRTLSIGGKNGWDTFAYEENISIGKGRFGYDCVEVSTNAFKYDEYTDILIDFEDGVNITGDYEILRNELRGTDASVMGKGAGLSRNTGGLSIMGKPGTFFGTEGLTGSFTIEFWLSPSLSENGEVVLDWQTSRTVDRRLIYQMINAAFESGRLEWTFTNLFDLYTGDNGEVKLSGTSTIIPDSWSYHVISFDSDTGIFEYIVNGITEDIKYITTSGDENGYVSPVILGSLSEISLCPDYTGRIDDFRILRRPYTPGDYQSAEMAGPLQHMTYEPSGGSFITKPMMLTTGSTIDNISATMNVPEQTSVEFFVRAGDNYFTWNDSYPEWKPVESGEMISGITGLYFQIKGILYPDGGGNVTPSVTELSVEYSELPPPLPPFTVRAVAGNGRVTLTWSYSVDESVGGYYIYYGNRSGEYLGRIAAEGASPLKSGNVTSYTLTGLENGRIYYFAIASWSVYDDRVIGQLSKEVFARPLERIKEK